MSEKQRTDLLPGARPPERPRFCPHCGKPASDEGNSCAHCGHDYVDSRIGRVLGGKYRIDALVGVGGFGRVYRATQQSLGSLVAVKFLLAEFATRPDLRVRFRREALALTQLSHPSIVGVHDFGEDGGEPYLVLEFVRGKPLSRCMFVDGELLPLSRVAAIVDEVLQVLQVAHAAGIVHRDMKPDNVMVQSLADGEDHVKVLDFGLALMTETAPEARLTASTAVTGTPLYMSPEQCRGRDVGPPTDIYAVGAMLYELLTGEPPFFAESSAEIIVQQLHVEPPPMATHGMRREVSAGLEALVRRALAKKPDDRPTASELREALVEAVRGTDSASRAEAAATERAEAAALPRDSRGLPQQASLAVTAPREVDRMRSPIEGDAPAVLLWSSDARRGATLSMALAANGVAARSWAGDAAPPPVADAATVGAAGATGAPDRQLRAAVIVADARAVERTLALKADPATGKLPVLVVEVLRAEDTSALIRAGASDVILAGAGDEVVTRKLWRLIRRGR